MSQTVVRIASPQNVLTAPNASTTIPPTTCPNPDPKVINIAWRIPRAVASELGITLIVMYDVTDIQAMA